MLGFEGSRATARHLMKEGEHVYCALSWSEHAPPAGLRRGLRPAGVDRPPLAALARPRQLPRPSVADLPAAQRADPQGPDLRPQRRAARGRHHLAARDAPGRAQLGLPLQLDPRLDVHAVGAAVARLRVGGQRLLLLHRRRRRRRGEPPGHVRRRRRARARRARARPPRGLRGARPVRIGNAAYKQEQHDVWGALLDSVYLHTRSRDSLDDRVWKILSRQVEEAIEHWRKPDRGIWEVRGEPKHFTSSKVFCWVACDRGARLAELREDSERAKRWREAADEIHADVLRARRRRPRRVRPALRHRRARRRAAAAAADALPAPRRRARSAPPCWPSPTS